jgi:hypothetical protein
MWRYGRPRPYHSELEVSPGLSGTLVVSFAKSNFRGKLTYEQGWYFAFASSFISVRNHSLTSTKAIHDQLILHMVQR